MEEKSTRVAVVAPVHNRRDITLQCLRSLREIDWAGLDVHIVIVDDGSTDGTGEAVRREFPDVEVLQGDGSLWYTAGTNRGITAGLSWKPEYLLAINDDSVFDPRFLRAMVDCAKSHPKSVVGALLRSWDEPDRIFQVGARWDTWYGGWRHRHDLTVENVPKEPWDVEIIVGNCVLYPAEAIEEMGLMNEKAFPHYGDVEYTPRMRKAGWRLLIEPRAHVYCQPNVHPPSLRTLPVSQVMKALLTSRRHPHHLYTRFLSCWSSAPTRLSGVAAFAVFLARFGLRWMGLQPGWPDRPDA